MVPGATGPVTLSPKNLIAGIRTRYESTPPAHMIEAIRGPINISDAEQSRFDRRGDRAAFKRRTKDFLRRVLPHSERAHRGLVTKTDSKTGEDHFPPPLAPSCFPISAFAVVWVLSATAMD